MSNRDVHSKPTPAKAEEEDIVGGAAAADGAVVRGGGGAAPALNGTNDDDGAAAAAATSSGSHVFETNPPPAERENSEGADGQRTAQAAAIDPRAALDEDDDGDLAARAQRDAMAKWSTKQQQQQTNSGKAKVGGEKMPTSAPPLAKESDETAPTGRKSQKRTAAGGDAYAARAARKMGQANERARRMGGNENGTERANDNYAARAVGKIDPTTETARKEVGDGKGDGPKDEETGRSGEENTASGSAPAPVDDAAAKHYNKAAAAARKTCSPGGSPLGSAGTNDRHGGLFEAGAGGHNTDSSLALGNAPGDDVAAAHFDEATAAAAAAAARNTPSSGAAVSGADADHRDVLISPRGATNDTPPSLYPVLDDGAMEEPPVTASDLMSAPVDNYDPREARPGAYETAGRAPGRLPAWGRRMPAMGRRMRDSIALTMTSRGSTASATMMNDEEMPYSVPAAEAVAVDESEIEDTIRREILASAARASIVEHPEKQRSAAEIEVHNRKKRRKYALLGAFAAALVGAVIGLAVAFSGRSSTKTDSSVAADDSGRHETKAGLRDIIQRGYLNCDGIPETEGNGDRMFSRDLCRAIAATLFGNTSRVRFIETTASNRFVLLANGTVDVLSGGVTHTMERNVHEPTAQTGFSFSVPYLYDGLSFGGVPHYAACADNLTASGECSGLKACVTTGTTMMDIVEQLLPAGNLVPSANSAYSLQLLRNGTCNAIVGERRYISEAAVREKGFDGPYSMGQVVRSKEPLALVTREADPLWSDLVNWVLQALFAAEKWNITQLTASTFPETHVFGEGLNSTMFRNVIAAVGNYGELYERHLGPVLPRDPVNKINTGDTGLIYSHPFGTLTNSGPGPVEGGTLERVQGREKLLCGVVGKRDASTSDVHGVHGLDMDFCRAIAAGATQSVQDDSVAFVDFPDASAGFEALSNGEIDVLSGAHVDIEKDVRDTVLGVGFSFTQPYFYGPNGEGARRGTRSLATRQDDPQWSDFVYWAVASTFLAEEDGITQSESNKMKSVRLFGDEHSRLFRDIVLRVGNYGEIYSRSLDGTTIHPRSGGNRLQRNPFGPQHFPLPFS